MDFGWNEAQRRAHERMRALGAEIDAMDPDARVRALAREGALGLPLPVDYGGGGLDLVTTAYAYEGLGATLGDGGALLAAGAHLFGVALTVLRVGTEAQRRAWLPRLATGEVLGTVAATEEGSGSDIGAAEAVAERTEKGFCITGRKRYVTLAEDAGVYFVVARDGPTNRGLTALLVPRETPGITVGERLRTAGLRSARLAPIELAGCEVSEGALLGRAGAGLAVFQIAMTFERALVLAFRLGAMERALDEAVRFARTRRVGGTPIAKHQAVAHRVARMKLRLETSRLLVYRAAWLLDQGARGQPEAALAKWHLAESAVDSALDAMEIRGGAGFLEESGLPAAALDALGGGIHSGTRDVLANIVASFLGVG
jgi:alkylation response protein AidB-like acyl-CoA dehydrogenase